VLIVPWNTDAPIYHWPFATVGLIATNALVLAWEFSAGPDAVLPYALAHGEGLQPLQWITSNFIHEGIMHLVGNMLFLWVFGLVVEGKIGSLRFLAIFFGIGILQNAVEQVLFSGSEDYSFGASSILFGLMAMALVWAPQNDIHCWWIWWYRTGEFDVPIIAFAAFYLGVEILFACLEGFAFGTSVLHLMGAAVGFPLAVLMLKLDWVDCEKWDLFAVLAGREGGQKLPSEIDAELAVKRKPDEGRENAAVWRVQMLSKKGEAAEAVRAYRSLADRGRLPEPDLLGLIQALHKRELWDDAVEVMRDYLARYPEKSPRVRLSLAQILIRHRDRPRQALQVLGKLAAESLPAQLEAARRQLVAQANRKCAEGVLEVQTEEW
jgi:membrane associated rhomboid family serine protease